MPGTQLSVVQNYPINDLGTGPAPKGNSNFQPLGSNIGAISTPAQNTESALSSMGQGGHNTNRAASTQNSNPYFRCVPLACLGWLQSILHAMFSGTCKGLPQ